MKASLTGMEDLAAPLNYWQMSRLVAGLEAENARLRRANERLGAWLSAALEDPSVCEAMKVDVNEWFAAQVR